MHVNDMRSLVIIVTFSCEVIHVCIMPRHLVHELNVSTVPFLIWLEKTSSLADPEFLNFHGRKKFLTFQGQNIFLIFRAKICSLKRIPISKISNCLPLN